MPTDRPVAVAITLALSLALAAAGCGGPELIPTPNLYIDAGEDPFADVPEVYQNNKVDVLYVTDRRPVEQEDGTVKYDHGRSYSMAFIELAS